jgi:FAD/FMN-containing dehydrogenase
LASPDDALAFLQIAKAAAGASLTTFELMPRLGLDLVLKHIPNTRDPIFEEHAWYVLLEFSSQSTDGADALAQAVMMEAVDKAHVEDGVFAVSLAQRDDFWRLRESLPEAQTREGYSVKHDISVPLDCLTDLIAAVSSEAQTMIDGIRPLPFGHLGDGNLHFNFQSPEATDGSDLKAHAATLHAMVYRHVLAMKGSISAEHGIGQVKRAQLAATKDPVALDLMRTLKAALDPDGRLNPGKVI